MPVEPAEPPWIQAHLGGVHLWFEPAHRTRLSCHAAGPAGRAVRAPRTDCAQRDGRRSSHRRPQRQERVISKVRDCGQRAFSFLPGTRPTMEGKQTTETYLREPIP